MIKNIEVDGIKYNGPISWFYFRIKNGLIPCTLHLVKKEDKYNTEERLANYLALLEREGFTINKISYLCDRAKAKKNGCPATFCGPDLCCRTTNVDCRRSQNLDYRSAWVIEYIDDGALLFRECEVKMVRRNEIGFRYDGKDEKK